MAFGYEGEKVRLVPIDVDRHLENYYRWLNNPEIFENLLVGGPPLTRLAERKFLESIDDRSSEIIFAIETLQGEHIGSSGIHQINHMHGTAITGSFLGDPTFWGKGYGTDAARVRARFCFDHLNLRILMSASIEGNERSQRMQTRVGYVECGRIPKRFWRNGSYRDEILTYMTRETFAAANPH